MQKTLPLFLAIALSLVTQAQQADTVRLLFIGNSYTYYNSMPELVKGIADQRLSNTVVETKTICQGGLALETHWERGEALKEIQSKKWDYVILQEQSGLGGGVTIDDKDYPASTDLFFEYARKFTPEIQKAGARPVFFMTWTRKNRPEQQDHFTYAYMTMAKEHSAMIAPVGLVWNELCSDLSFDLYTRDGSHPSPYGSYTTASTIFSTIFETGLDGISGDIKGQRISSRGNKSDKIEQLVSIPSKHALIIQKAVQNVSDSLKPTNGYLEIAKPDLGYTIPNVRKGKPLTRKNLDGRWYGTSTYGSHYL